MASTKKSNIVSVRFLFLEAIACKIIVFPYTEKMEPPEDSKHKRRSSSKEFRLKVVKYNRDNMKNNNKTTTHFHVDRKRVSAFLSYTIFL